MSDVAVRFETSEAIAIARKFRELLPAYKVEMTLTHNAHKASYHTVADWLDFLQAGEDDWVFPEDRQIAIDTDNLWQLQWYPETPVGFCVLYAASLESLLWALEKMKPTHEKPPLNLS